MQFSGRDINGQPLPGKERTDDRYELLSKFQGAAEGARLHGHRRAGRPRRRAAPDQRLARADAGLVWPMLDNKFLKQPGLGLKLLLPIELADYIEKEDRDFYQRARLDKQNMIPSLEWTGQALYDLANARVAACAAAGATPQLARSVRRLDHRRAADRRLPHRCACRGTCSSSCTACWRPTASSTSTRRPSGRSRRPRSKRS